MAEPSLSGYELNNTILIPLTIEFNFIRDDGLPERIEKTLNVGVMDAWDIAQAINQLGPRVAQVFAEFLLTVERLDEAIKDATPAPIFLEKVNGAITLFGSLLGPSWNNEEDRVLDFTYNLLRTRRITRQQAADFASAVLNSKFEKDNYRKKLDRWVKGHGFTKIGQPKRPSRKEN